MPLDLKTWKIVANIFPIDDLIEHEGNETCICGPYMKEINQGSILVHHPLDLKLSYEN